MSAASSPPLYLHGRSLACALGLDLEQTLRAMSIEITDTDALFLGIPDIPQSATPSAHNWYSRAQKLVLQAAMQAQAETDGALLLASTSFNVGALEQGAPWPPDGHTFVDDVANWLSWRGPVYAVATACTSALNALRAASTLLASGEVDSALILGFELRNRFTAGGFGALQLRSHSGRARPWATDCDGLVLGEAVAALHLRREPARWCIRGSANVVDGRDAYGPSEPAIKDAVSQALEQAGLRWDAIDLIKLHAAGSMPSDLLEWQALCATFPQRPARITFKHLCGHTLGASAAAEIALLTASLDADRWPIPPSAQAHPAFGCALSAIRPQRLRHILALFLGFGGGHTALVLEDTHA